MGLTIDEERNRRGAGPIATAGSRLSAWVIATDEELLIARAALGVLAA
jgi:acetate kinase